MKVGILGPGAVGGFLAALFDKKGVPVVCIANENSAKFLNENGIELESPVFTNFRAWPVAVSEVKEELDLIFVTTKAGSLAEAMRRIDPALVRKAVIVPLLNGIEHMEILRNYFGPRLVAGSINIAVDRPELGKVVHTSYSDFIKIASDKDISEEDLVGVTTLLRGAGMEVQILGSEAEVLWNKLVLLNAISCTITASVNPIGFVRSDMYWRGKIFGVVQESCAVAKKEGAEIKVYEVMAQIDKLPEILTTSMFRDVVRGLSAELDSIAGAIVRAGKKHDLACPTIEELITIIQTMINRRS